MDSTHADVAVVGGGIIGSCTAFYLARSGADVLVLDPAPGTGASAGNAGMLVPSQSVTFANPATVGAWLSALARRDSFVTLRRPLSPGLVPWIAGSLFEARPWRASRTTRLLYHLARKSLRLYEELTEAEGIDLRLRSTGSLRVFRSTAAFRRQHRMVRTLARLGAECELLGPRALREAEPALHPDLAGAIGFPHDRSLDPARATLAIADAARAYGARFRAETVVGARRANGRVHSGPRSVRLTTGTEFGGTAGDEPPAGAGQRLDAAVRSFVPTLPSRDTAGAPWRGGRPMTPSGIPRVGRIGENVVAATGHGTLGMTLGPVTGTLVSSLVTR